MRVLIMADMEGVSGIVVWEQVTGGTAMYQEARRLYTEEVNAAVRGAKAAGADEIVVVDFHGAGGNWSFNSLLPELLDEHCEWVAHHSWTRYTELFERGCDACLIVGMHARAGTPDGVLAHTVTESSWRNLWFNGELVGEIAINAAWCGHYGVPLLMVAGDAAACREAHALLGEGVATVAVKHGLTRYSARQVPPLRARQLIEQGARDALRDLSAVAPYVPDRPTRITLELDQPDKLREFAWRPGVRVVEALKIESQADHWLAAWNQIWD